MGGSYGATTNIKFFYLYKLIIPLKNTRYPAPGIISLSSMYDVTIWSDDGKNRFAFQTKEM